MNNETDDKLMAQAARLSTEIAPERDLWPDVAAAIETPRRRSNWLPYLAQAAAVVLLVGASSSITYVMTKGDAGVSPVIATVAGISQGAMGMSGPFIATWIHSYRLRKEAYVFGVSVMFLGISAIHIAGVSTAGLMDQTRLLQGLVAVIPTVIFVPIGMRMTRTISQQLFNRLIIALVIVMEGKLIWQVATTV